MSWFRSEFLKSSRYLHASTINQEKEVSTHKPQVDAGSDQINAVPLRPIDKRLFVWSGKYKRIEDVPDRAGRAAIAKAQSVCRIKACNYMIVAVIIASGFYIMSGKRDAERGLTIGKMNEEWHKEYNRKYEEEQKKKMNQ